MTQEIEYVYCLKFYDGGSKVCTLTHKPFVVGTKEYFTAKKDFEELIKELNLEGYEIIYEDDVKSISSNDAEIVDISNYINSNNMSGRKAR